MSRQRIMLTAGLDLPVLLHERRCFSAHRGSASTTIASLPTCRRAVSARSRVGYLPIRTRYGLRAPTTRAVYPRPDSRFARASASDRVSKAATCTLNSRAEVVSAGGVCEPVLRGVDVS